MSDFCPLIQKKCKKHSCLWWMQVQGKNANTGEDVNEFGCAITWLPLLLINSAKETRETAAAIESFRNEMVKINENPNVLLQ